MVDEITRRGALAGASAGIVLALSGLMPRRAVAASQGAFPGEEADDERPIGRMTRSASSLAPLTAPFLDETGRTITLAQFAGRPVILHLWATWCPPCRLELPQVDRTMRDLGAAGPLIVPVAAKCGDAGKVRAFYAKTNVATMPVFVDAPGALITQLTTQDHVPQALPATFILDAHGAIVARHLGNMQWSADGVRQAVRTTTGSAA